MEFFKPTQAKVFLTVFLSLGMYMLLSVAGIGAVYLVEFLPSSFVELVFDHFHIPYPSDLSYDTNGNVTGIQVSWQRSVIEIVINILVIYIFSCLVISFVHFVRNKRKKKRKK